MKLFNATHMKNNIFYRNKWIVILGIIILLSGCLQEKAPSEAAPSSQQDIQKIVQTPTVKTIAIERISDEMNMLNSKGWSQLSGQLGRTKATTLLWYHIKSNYNMDTRIVFGNPNKLDSSIAILASMGGESPLPKVTIKGDEYYVINPSTPGIISEFNYGYVFNDPRGADNYLGGSFSLGRQDNEKIEQWMGQNGVKISYTDLKKTE
ncbi:MAG: hypothetical protein OIN87_10455 [Candidatus Methanoperedens sp.]|nr:hypothetical protein [Candidatus Methanoperedens sp.]